ncbi:MAG: helix-turn-helix transcriptional regulator [Anaerolineae bacterium]|nr:helix-turn-helix transcriptional regulator [Anaerolineae bacterium]
MRKENLAFLMTKRGISEVQLAEEIGVSERTIFHYKQGKYVPDSRTLTKLATALRTSSDYLLGLTEDPTSHIKIDNLTQQDKEVIEALHRDDKIEAIRLIASH